MSPLVGMLFVCPLCVHVNLNTDAVLASSRDETIRGARHEKDQPQQPRPIIISNSVNKCPQCRQMSPLLMDENIVCNGYHSSQVVKVNRKPSIQLSAMGLSHLKPADPNAYAFLCCIAPLIDEQGLLPVWLCGPRRVNDHPHRQCSDSTHPASASSPSP